MRGSIRKRGKQKNGWTLVLDHGKDPETGKRRQQWKAFHGTKKAAEAELARMVNEIESGGYVPPAHETVGQFFARWLKDYAATNTTPRTVEGYKAIYRLYVEKVIGGVQVDKVTAGQVQAIYGAMEAKGLAARTIRHTHTLVREVLGYALRWGVTTRNVTDAVSAPKPVAHDAATLDEEGVERFLVAADGSPFLPFYALALYSGMRRGELAALRWQDVDLERAAISVRQALVRVTGQGWIVKPPKSAAGKRRIDLSPEIAAMLRRHRTAQLERRLAVGPAWQDGDYVFTRPAGLHIDPDEATRAFTRIARAAGIKGVTLHGARHTHASIMLAQGVHPRIVQERLGHGDINTTMTTYSHVLPGLQGRAALQFEEGLKGVGKTLRAIGG
ncbi:MAG: tyrosine-type recombinase/integrase [Chloroflexi bacterium]|nr:tyrosine-type recombinase/integrase [Chloroflexota bacterium]